MLAAALSVPLPAMPLDTASKPTTSKPLTNRLPAYMPTKSRSCCSRVTHSAASMAIGSTKALQPSDAAPSALIWPCRPGASAWPMGSRNSQISTPSSTPAASSARATRRWPCCNCAGFCCAHTGSNTYDSAPLIKMLTSKSGSVNITMTASPRPVAPKTAACADSRSSPKTRLRISKPRDRTPARKYIAGDYQGWPRRNQQETARNHSKRHESGRLF